MEYTEPEKSEFREEFKRRRSRQIFLAVPLIAMILLFAVLRGRKVEIPGVPVSVLGPLFLALVVAALVYSLYNWRCPACNRYLGRDLSPRFCNKCGVNLQ
jgi:hypothetical protein